MTDREELIEYYTKREKEFSEVWDKYKSPQPEYVYHYTSLNSLISIIDNEALYMSNCEFLNDSSEILYLRNIIKDVVENEAGLYLKDPTDNYKRQFIEIVLDNFDKHVELLFKNIFILSLSDSEHSTSMWNGYADNDGYRIKFKFETIFNEFMSTGYHNIYSKDPRKTELVKTYTYSNRVIYDESIQYSFVKEYLNIFSDIFYHFGGVCFTDKNETEFNNSKISEMLTNLFYFGCTFKDSCFDHEKENRIILALDHNSDDRIKYQQYRQSKSSIIPFIEIDFRMPDIIPILEIEIGPKINIDIAEKGLQRYLESTKYNNVKITKSKIPIRY